MTLEETGIWINLSKSGKALNFTIGNEHYTLAISNVESVINGSRKGTKLSKFVPDPEKQAEYREEREKAEA